MSTKCRTCDKVCSYRTGDYVPEYAALLARNNALWNFYNQLENAMYDFEKEARIERMKRVAAERFAARYKEIAASAVDRHNALKEAVKWERECEAVAHWQYEVWELAPCGSGHNKIYGHAVEIHAAARAEVDRLIADCKGEG